MKIKMSKFIKASSIKIEPIFPQNYFNYKLNNQGIDFSEESEKFLNKLDEAKNENEIQSYIKKNKKMFIPYSLLDGYPFYNHGGEYLFVEQKLGEKFQVDYCLLGDNSDGYHLLFVEFENPNADFILSDKNGVTESVRKGLIQINDWKDWMDDNRTYFLSSLGLTSKGINIPTTRINYLLVVSRRKFMDERAKTLRSRLTHENRNLNIITYDRLVDNILKL